MRRAPFFLLAVLLPAEALFAAPAGYVVIRSLVLPPTFYVGDRVELRVTIQPARGVDVHAPDSLPLDRWVHIDEVDVRKGPDGTEVSIFLEVYAPGRRALPPIRLGGITLGALSVEATSLASGGRPALSEPKGQLFLPGTGLALALLIGVVFGVPPLLYLSVRAGRGLSRRFRERREFERPWRRFGAVLERLARSEGYRDPRGFYILLCDELRLYLTARVHRDFLTATARELGPLLLGALAPGAGGPVERLPEVVTFAEKVKFAGLEAGGDSLARDLEAVETAVGAIEARKRAEREAARLSRTAARRPSRPAEARDAQL